VIDQARFDELTARHKVPGATLAVAVGTQVWEFASGVLNVATGVTATPDSLFHIGSISKPYTATAFMRLLEQGLVSLDTRVVEVLPHFKVADAQITEHVTMRHLLNHTSGIAGDFFHDTGRGDDALARYVADCADLAPDHPLGATFSYSNTGFSILGHVTEVLTGSTWDQLIRDLVLNPIGADHTWSLPEDVLRFRAAMGHVPNEAGDHVPGPFWQPGPRSEGPAGGICASAADVVKFARLHLTDPALAVMQEPTVTVPNPIVDQWGLGWTLWNWGGRTVVGHQGDTVGQSGFLVTVPDADVVLVLLTNTNESAGLYRELFPQLLDELCGVAMPGPWKAPGDPAPLSDPENLVGHYTRSGMHFEITYDGELKAEVTPRDFLALFIPPYTLELVPASDTLFFSRTPGGASWRPMVIENATIYDGLRAALKVTAA
jgi:CubicO group peptidase (beta-lactamase class C family)